MLNSNKKKVLTLTTLHQLAWTQGTPQGAVISPLLANIYLHRLDETITKHGYQIIRYADDFVIMCKTLQEAEHALLLVQAVMEEIKLTLHPDKTHIVNMSMADAAFEFLGYRFKNHKGRILKYPRPKSIAKMRDKIRDLTPRCSGKSLQKIVERINSVTTGWFTYFKHSSSQAFKSQDSWIRSRLRAILRRRRKTGSRNRYGKAHQLWSNQFFHDLELYCMDSAHTRLRAQPARR